MVTCNTHTPEECQKMHERVSILEVEARNRDLLNIELKKAIEDLKNAIKNLNKDYMRVNEQIVKHEVKIKKNCEELQTLKQTEIATLKNNQWKIILSTIGLLVMVVGYLLDKYVIK